MERRRRHRGRERSRHLHASGPAEDEVNMLGGDPIRRDVQRCGSLQLDAGALQGHVEVVEIDRARALERAAQHAASSHAAGDDALAHRPLIPQTGGNGRGDRRPIEAGLGVVVVGADDVQIHSSPRSESRRVRMDLCSCAVERDRGADASDGRSFDLDLVCCQRRLPSRSIDRSLHVAFELCAPRHRERRRLKPAGEIADVGDRHAEPDVPTAAPRVIA